MAGMSPEDYRAAAGYRRSHAAQTVAAPRRVPVSAYNAYDINDPALIEFMRDGAPSVTGVVVSDHVALRNSVFYRSLALVSGSIGMLPLHLMRRLPDGRIEKARDHSLFRVLHRKSNSYQTAVEFKTWMQIMAMLDGTAYALVIRGARGKITQLIPLPRKSVRPKLSSDYELTFEYRRPSGGTVTLSTREVMYFRSPVTIDGLTGVSLLKIAADTIGLASKATRAAARLMTKGVMASGSLETDAALGEEAIANLKQSLQEDYSGVDADNDWLILEEGLKAKPFGGSAKDAQLAELRKAEAEEMSRFTGVPRPLLMFDETSWGSGIEQLGLFFVTYCLMVWFVIWEEAVWRLLDDDEQESTDGTMLYAKFNERALLRGSMKDQAEFFSKALGAGGGFGWSTQNEARHAFDMNPHEDGNDLPRPGTTAAAAVEDAEPEPDPQPAPNKKQKQDA